MVFLAAVVAVSVAACGEPSERAQPPARPLPTAPTPPDVERACREAAVASMRCPTLLPAPAAGQSLARALDLEGAGDFARGGQAWLLSWAYRGLDQAEPQGGAFHVIAGGRRVGRGGEDPLRLIGSAGLEPGDPPGTESPAAPPRTLGRTTVAASPARILTWYDIRRGGTIHAGHQGLVWRNGDAEYVLTAHFLEDTPPDRRLATLRAVALSFRPPP